MDASLAENIGLALRLRLYRRVLPFLSALPLFGIFQPKFSGNPSVDTLISAIGILLCATGQSLRLWAWGSNAATGKLGVRYRGAYALMRHPLYAGNFLIAAGLAVNYNNPVAYLLLVAPFAFVYYKITRSEEQNMTKKFAFAYERYRAACSPRFLPALGNLGSAVQTTFPFDWGFAWRKEYSSCCAWVAGLAGLELYKEVLAYGWTRHWSSNWFLVAVMGICGTVTLALNLRKRRSMPSGLGLL
jgi:protein-S-isoprenylcysteine O-methyltransferase Ste14